MKFIAIRNYVSQHNVVERFSILGIHEFNEGSSLNRDVNKFHTKLTVNFGRSQQYKTIFLNRLTDSLIIYSKKTIEELGGKVVNSVSKNTNYLLAGNKAGSKLSKAEKLNVNILNEEDFLILLTQ